MFGDVGAVSRESVVDILLTLRDVTEERRLAQIKSDFVSNASHELRTPLTNIRGYLEAIAGFDPGNTAPESSFVDVALGNALRMKRLLDDLLELSRAETGAVSWRGRRCPCRAFSPVWQSSTACLRSGPGKSWRWSRAEGTFTPMYGS